MPKVTTLTDADRETIEALPRKRAATIAKQYHIGVGRLHRIWAAADARAGVELDGSGLSTLGRPMSDNIYEEPRRTRKSAHFIVDEPETPEPVEVEDYSSASYQEWDGCSDGSGPPPVSVASHSDCGDSTQTLSASSVDETGAAIERLQLLMGAVEAGNSSLEVRDEGLELVGMLKGYADSGLLRVAKRVFTRKPVRRASHARSKKSKRGAGSVVAAEAVPVRAEAQSRLQHTLPRPSSKQEDATASSSSDFKFVRRR